LLHSVQVGRVNLEMNDSIHDGYYTFEVRLGVEPSRHPV